MPKTATVFCPAGAPTLLTDAAVDAARVEGSEDFYLCATVDANAPADFDGALFLLRASILATDLPLRHLFPGLGEILHLWAWPPKFAANVAISHA